MISQDAPELVEIRLIGIPLDLQRAASEHHEGLRREFQMLLVQGEADSTSVPARLVRLAGDLSERFSAFTAAGKLEMEQAMARGDEAVDIDITVPTEIAGAVRDFMHLLEEADEYCRAGKHLLALATPPEPARYRNWLLGEFIRQARGEPPLPWGEVAGQSGPDL